MIKTRIRNQVYKYKILEDIWTQTIEIKDRNRFKHRKLFNKVYFRYLEKNRGYEALIFEKKIVNGMFKVFKSKDRNTVIKVFRKDNHSSYNFYKYLRNKDNYLKYTDTVNSANNLEIIGDNISSVIKICKDGGYVAPYIKGDNLQIIKLKIEANEYRPENKESTHLLQAISNLITNLESYNKKFGFIPGDWMLYNMVFDKEELIIKNIDLEGFYTYRKSHYTNNLDRIKKDLEEVVWLLKQKYEEVSVY